MRVLFTGGGTGGHLFPIVAVARQLKKIATRENIRLEMRFVGAKNFSNGDLVKENISVKTIVAGKIRRYFSFQNFLDFFRAPFGLLQSFWHLLIWMPDVIFSKGGYGSVPVVLVGWLFRIPIISHESDSVPGLANRLAAPFSKRIAISFAIAAKFLPSKKTALTGHPVRLEVCFGNKKVAKQYFNIASEKPVILVIGGSQGALAINTIVLGSLPMLNHFYHIILVCGHNHYQTFVDRGLTGDGLSLYPFLNEEQLKHALAASDLIISRAGAGSIFEIAACGKPSILIPLPGSASDHQRQNAYEYAKSGATVIIEQNNLLPHLFLREIDRLFADPIFLPNMAKAATLFGKIHAADQIARGLIELGK